MAITWNPMEITIKIPTKPYDITIFPISILYYPLLSYILGLKSMSIMNQHFPSIFHPPSRPRPCWPRYRSSSSSPWLAHAHPPGGDRRRSFRRPSGRPSHGASEFPWDSSGSTMEFEWYIMGLYIGYIIRFIYDLIKLYMIWKKIHAVWNYHGNELDYIGIIMQLQWDHIGLSGLGFFRI